MTKILLHSKRRKMKTIIKSTVTFIILTGIFTSLVLYYYSFLLKGVIPESGLFREFAICFGQLIFQSILLLCFNVSRQKIAEYLKVIMTISFTGAILLLPAFLIHYFTHQPIVFLICFLFVAAIMFFIHIKKVSEINAPGWLSITWVLYRCLVLIVILYV